MDRVISYLQARKMISIVYFYHLIRDKDSNSEIQTFESVPVVSEFPKVSQEDLPGVPLEREIEFAIDII